jgi:hypothetical protein
MLAERHSRFGLSFLSPVRSTIAVVLGLAGILTGLAPALAVDAATPIRLAVAVPLALPEGTSALISPDALAQYTAPAGLLTRQLDAVINRPVAIGIDPMIIVSIRVLGDSAPPSALGWLDRLRSASNETFPLAFADTDLSLVTQAGASAGLGPESFDFAIDPSLFAAHVDATSSATPTPTPTPTNNSGLPSYPSTADLLEWPYTVTGIAWPRDNSIIGSDLAAIAASGYTSTIVASGNLDAESSATSAVEAGGRRLLVSDDTVSAALRAAVAAPTTAEWQSSMSQVFAAIAAAGAEHRGQSAVFATLARTVPINGGHMAETLAALAARGDIAMTSTSLALGDKVSAGKIADKPQPAGRLAQATQLLAAEAAERRFASVAKNPQLITSDRRLRLVRLLSNAWESNPAGRDRAASAFLLDSIDLRKSVRVVESSSFNLLADRGALPIAVRNDLDQPVSVYVTVRPQTGLLAVGDRHVKIVIEPHSQGKAQVPVQAISNGTVRLTVTLTSASGEDIGAHTTTKINVQAGWETPIVVVIALLVFAVFGVGIVRSILRRRKSADE